MNKARKIFDALLIVLGVAILLLQIALIICKMLYHNLSWGWVLTPTWITIIICFVIPVSLSLTNKFINFIKSKKC